MKSKVTRSMAYEQAYIKLKNKISSINLNEDEEESLPLEYNFSTNMAQLNGTTYTFSFPEMWRTSKNKNIIGIRKINYFKGKCTFDFDICFVWKYGSEGSKVVYAKGCYWKVLQSNPLA